MELRPGFKRTLVGDIPKEWAAEKVESIVDEISMGPFGSDIKVSNFKPHGVPVLSGANVASERLTDSFTNFVTEQKVRELKNAVARRGDIVVTHRGTLGQISYIPPNSAFDRYVISQSQFRVRFSSGRVDPAWPVLYFLSVSGSKALLEKKGHTGVPAIAQPTTSFRELYIPLPPLAEQRAIATALSDVDALIDALDKLIAKKRNLKQAAMQQLLTGQTRLPGFSGEWEVKQLGDVALIRNQKVMPTSVAAETPCIELEHIGQGNGHLQTFSEARNSTASKYRFYMGDVLFGRLRPYLRKYWLASWDGICTTEVWPLVAVAHQMTSGFLHAIVQTEQFIDAAGVSYGTHMPRADWSVIRELEIRVPEVPEQTAIAQVLSDMDAELTALEARRDKTRALKQGMMQELLAGRIRLVSAPAA